MKDTASWSPTASWMSSKVSRAVRQCGHQVAPKSSRVFRPLSRLRLMVRPSRSAREKLGAGRSGPAAKVIADETPVRNDDSIANTVSCEMILPCRTAIFRCTFYNRFPHLLYTIPAEISTRNPSFAGLSLREPPTVARGNLMLTTTGLYYNLQAQFGQCS